MKLPNGDRAIVDGQKQPIRELDVVALLADLSEEGLMAGQTGTAVFVHDGGRAFEVEFIQQPRKSVIATISADRLLKLRGLSVA